MLRYLRACGSLVVTVALFTAAWAAPARADQLWVAPTYQQDLGGLGVASNVTWPATVIGASRFALGVPDNLQAFQNAKVALIPHAPGGAATLNVIICAAESGDPVAGACAGPFPHAFTGTVNQLIEVDISAVVAPRVGAAGANHLAILVYTTPTTVTDHIVGLRFGFDAMPPAGVAVLGANTFSGTQTAPAFVGSGSGLANVNANLLDGLDSTAFAAAAHGHDVSQVTNAAKLGANVFTATQTIDGGNLDLDPSTSSAGNVMKNGTRFLHTVGATGNLFLGASAGNLGASTTNSTENTGIGSLALSANLFGHDNTAVGASALRNDPGGSHNTAVGSGAMEANIGGFHNTALGSGALIGNTSGRSNTSIGFATMLFNTTGEGNTTLGLNGLALLSDGSYNLGVGFQAGHDLVTGSHNIYVGNPGVNTESDTIRIGDIQTRTFLAGVRGTTPATPDAVPVVIDSLGQLGTVAPGGIATLAANTFAGSQTIDAGNLDLDNSTPTTGSLTKNGSRFLHNFGSSNTFVGVNAGNLTMTGVGNTGAGVSTLLANTSGSGNVALGGAALIANTSGSGNTATGVNAMGDNTTGLDNSATGNSALRHNTSGGGNTAIGLSALFNTTTGNFNTAVGNHALRDNTTGQQNTAIGFDADVSTGNLTNATAVGFGAIVDANNKVRIGNANVTLVETAGNLRVGAGSLLGCVQDGDGTVLTGTCISDARFKTGVTPFASLLDKLVDLEPVHFMWKAAEYPHLQLGSAPSFGLIAQEAEKVLPELVAENSEGYKVVKYHLLPLMLVRAVKEQQAIIERQAIEHDALKAQVDRLEQLIAARGGF